MHQLRSSYLDTYVFVYNTSRHESTKYCPFECMFGRKATLPIDFDLQKESPSDVQQKYTTLDEPDTSTNHRERENCLEMAKKNNLEAQAKQKANYDKRHAKLD